ncbi:MAG: DUF5132 domain-containing protein [Dehalococcoidia bacterium]
MDELFGAVPGGPWVVGAIALLAVPGVRRSLRPLAKGAVKVGLNLADGVKTLTAETREQAGDLYEEAKAEREQSEQRDQESSGAVSEPSKAAPAASTTRRTEPLTTAP